jgi:hypothetical protein
MEPKTVAITLMFAALVAGVLLVLLAKNDYERFEEETDAATTDNKNKPPSVENKLHVIEMFNLLLDRNPSPDEIEKYGALSDKDAVSHRIIEDYAESSSNSSSAPPKTKDNKPRGKSSVAQRLRAIADELDASA